MKTQASRLARLALIASLLLCSVNTMAGFGTTVPVTADVATSIAGSVFPQTIALDKGSLYVSEPLVIYPDPTANGPKRISLQVNVQVLQRQPDQTLVATLPARAQLSGEVGYDRETAQILLINARVESLEFDPAEKNAEQLRIDLDRNWKERITNPLRVDVPAHPYLLPFKQGIRDISFQEQGIVVDVWFE